MQQWDIPGLNDPEKGRAGDGCEDDGSGTIMNVTIVAPEKHFGESGKLNPVFEDFWNISADPDLSEWRSVQSSCSTIPVVMGYIKITLSLRNKTVENVFSTST